MDGDAVHVPRGEELTRADIGRRAGDGLVLRGGNL